MKFYLSSYMGEFIGAIVAIILFLCVIIVQKNEFLGIKTKMQKRVFGGVGMFMAFLIGMLSAHLTHQTHGWINPAFAFGYSGKDGQAAYWSGTFPNVDFWFGIGVVIMLFSGTIVGTFATIGGVYAFNALTNGKVINLKETFTWQKEDPKGFGRTILKTVLIAAIIGFLMWTTFFGAYMSNQYTDDGSEVRNWHDGYTNNHVTVRIVADQAKEDGGWGAFLQKWHLWDGDKKTLAAAMKANVHDLGKGAFAVNSKFDTSGSLPFIFIVSIVYGIFAFAGGKRATMWTNPIAWLANFIITLVAQRKITLKQFANEFAGLHVVIIAAFAGGLVSHGLIHADVNII